jgi:DNA-binding CsgD family transcriptional regulator/PAS domain-containing protein
MAKRTSFEKLLSRLYASGTRADGFLEFVGALGASFNSHISCLQLHDLQHHMGRMDLSVGIPAIEIAKCTEHASNNLWLERGGARLISQGIVDDYGLVPKDELKRSAFYRKQLCPLEVEHGLGFCLHANAAGQFATVTVNRDKRRDYFQSEELRFAKRLLPHLRNIYALQQRLSWAENLLGGFRTALDRLPTGAILLDRHGRTVFANQEAQRLYADRCGLGEYERQPVALCIADREPLRRLIERACASVLHIVPETLSLHGADGRPVATVTAALVPPSTTFGWVEPSVVAVLFVRRLHPAAQPAADILRQTFGFTQAEAKLADLLREGATVADACARLHKSLPTVRTQLRALFAKTGTRRQAELVRLLMTAAAADAGR